jgi:hypothetical protein
MRLLGLQSPLATEELILVRLPAEEVAGAIDVRLQGGLLRSATRPSASSRCPSSCQT